MTAGPLPSRRGALGPTRRGVLAAGLALPLTACTGSSPAPAPSSAPSTGPSTRPPSAPDRVGPDVALREAAVERELALLAAYDDVLAETSTPALLALRSEHAEHLAALDPAVAVPAAPTGDRRDPSARARTRLQAVEREAAAAHAADALPASRALASLLASLAAAEAAHGVVLA